VKRAFSRPLAFGLLLLVTVLPGAAQQTSPSSKPKGAPNPDVLLKPGDSTSTEDEHPKHHRFDLKFLIPWAIAIGTQVAAVEATQHCLHAGTCGAVSSPVFGGRPSRLKMYSILGAFDAASFYISWDNRKEGESAFWWMAPPVIVGSAGGFSLYDVLSHQHHRAASPVQRRMANMPAKEVVVIAPK
jgi:hypothetical protein